MKLVLAADGELREIVDLINLAYRGMGDSAGWTVETSYIEGQRITLADLREDLAEHPNAVLLRWRDERDGTLLGSVWLEPEDDGSWYLGLLSVSPDRQDRQLGRQLLAAAEEFAREGGARRIRMSVVHLRETLIAWYKRRGYTLTGETKAFPYGEGRAGRPLRDDLYFVVLEKTL